MMSSHMHVPPLAILILVVGFLYLYRKSFSPRSVYFFGLVGWIVGDLLINVGYFVKLGGVAIRYAEFFLAIAFLGSVLLAVTSERPSGKFLCAAVFSSIMIVLSVAAHFVNGHTALAMLESSTDYSWDAYAAGQAVLQNVTFGSKTLFLLAKFVMASFVLSFVPVEFRKEDIDRFFVATYRIYLAYLGYLIVEFVVIYAFKSNALREATLKLFGDHDLVSTYTFYSGRMYGFFSEPSLLALSLFEFLLLTLYLLYERKLHVGLFGVTTLAALALMVASRSFSSVLFAAIYYALFVFFVLREKCSLLRVAILVVLPIVFGTVLLSANNGYFLERLTRALGLFGNLNPETREFTSEWIRFYSIFYSFNLWFQHPLFGVGFNCTYSYSCISSVLATVGLFGLAALLVQFVVLYGEVFQRNISSCALVITVAIYCFIGTTGNLLLYYPSTIAVLSFLSLIISPRSASDVLGSQSFTYGLISLEYDRGLWEEANLS